MHRPIKLALIGAHGAGKTTLAAGYAAVRPSVGGTDDTSRTFLEGQLRAWDNREWPAQTKDKHEIKLRIGQNGRHDAEVSFAEYMGEDFSGDAQYLKNIVKMPEAALILVNPDMSDFTDPQKRAGLETDTKKVIDYLVGLAKKPDDRPVLALVWTASDTEAAQSDEFRTFSRRIFDYVGGRLPCKEFPVTLFGPLENQLVPPGRPADPDLNTAPKPFEWALEIVESRRRAANRKKVFRWTLQGVGAVLLAALLGLVLRSGCRRFAEDGRHASLQGRFDRFVKAPAENADPQSLKNWTKDWTTATNRATDRTRARLVDLGRQFESSLPDWQRRQLEKEADAIVDNLNRVEFNPPPPQPIVANFQKWYRQAARLEESRPLDYPAVRESDFEPVRDKLSRARQASMTRFTIALSAEDAIDGSLIETVWRPILGSDEYEEFWTSIRTPVIEVMTGEAQTEIKSLESNRGDPAGILQRCRSWCTKHQSNPDMEQVVEKAISLVGDWLLGFSERSRRMPSPDGAIRKNESDSFNNEFDKFRLLCKEAKNAFWNAHATRWPLALGRECADQPWFTDAMKPADAFPQTLTLSKVEVVWEKEGNHWCGGRFDGYRISFDVFKQGLNPRTKVLAGPKDSRDSNAVQLKRKQAQKRGLPLTETIWTGSQPLLFSLGESLCVDLKIRDSLSSSWRWSPSDSILPFKVEFKTLPNGSLDGFQPGGLVEKTQSFAFKNSGDKAKMTFRIYVSLEGRSLESMIREFQARNSAP